MNEFFHITDFTIISTELCSQETVCPDFDFIVQFELTGDTSNKKKYVTKTLHYDDLYTSDRPICMSDLYEYIDDEIENFCDLNDIEYDEGQDYEDFFKTHDSAWLYINKTELEVYLDYWCCNFDEDYTENDYRSILPYALCDVIDYAINNQDEIVD